MTARLPYEWFAEQVFAVIDPELYQIDRLSYRGVTEKVAVIRLQHGRNEVRMLKTRWALAEDINLLRFTELETLPVDLKNQLLNLGTKIAEEI